MAKYLRVYSVPSGAIHVRIRKKTICWLICSLQVNKDALQKQTQTMEKSDTFSGNIRPFFLIS